ncbi:unnamed protein product [Rhodiola kirilowii]
MKLQVRVEEARNLPVMDVNGEAFVKLKMGKQKHKTRGRKKSLNPCWGEEFCFKVEDLNVELVVSVLREDKFMKDDVVGRLKVPMSIIFESESKSLGTAWYSLRPKSKKSKQKDCGEILLTMYFLQNNGFADLQSSGIVSKRFSDTPLQTPSMTPSMTPSTSRSPSISRNSLSQTGSEEIGSSMEDKAASQKSFAGRIAQIFNKNGDLSVTSTSKTFDTSESEMARPETEDNKLDELSTVSFEDTMRTLEVRDSETEMPSNLPGGVLLDQLYMMAPRDLNYFMYSNDSEFPKTLADIQETTELHVGPWKFENSGDSLKRTLTYVKPPSKLIKSVKVTEEQTYIKADGKHFAVLASVSIPDVPYGSTFRTELLYCITPGPELPSGEKWSHLVISWRLNFIQSTMMKGMIENGARQGIKESFGHFTILLAQKIKVVESRDMGSNQEQLLASLQGEPQSDWKLAVQYLFNFSVVSTIIVGIYVISHIWIAMPSTIHGLEVVGIDLPDSIGEIIFGGILVLQCKRVLKMLARFIQARAQKSTDHGVKAQGDGWLLTVALVEGSNVGVVDASGVSDPYVVFTCNGRTRTSSIKFQKVNPAWNEIFEFDAMGEPPSMLMVEVFDFAGPFDEATFLGHAEINFIKSNLSDLADIWIPLDGKLALASQAKLHLRIFLNNSRGGNSVKEYLNKMEKEVGKKLNVRSPQTNSAFQKLFGLPPEEFLINDFTCHLKRKMPLQGRLFLSARILGFNANLFGHKTKFFFLWEDIEDIQVLPPTLSSMGSPILIIILRKGRGLDARHGAKMQDEEGRLKFHFQSFVSFNVANRTIMALWKARSLTPEQKVKIVEQESGDKIQNEECVSFLEPEDDSMTEIFCSSLTVPARFVIKIFSGGDLEHKVMEKAGCVEYSHSPWEVDKDDVYLRQTYYKFDKRVSRYRGEVTSTQKRCSLCDSSGWLIEEVLNIHGVPFAEYFNIHLKYQIEEGTSRSDGCTVRVLFGITWLKSTKQQKKVTKSIVSTLLDRLKGTFSVLEMEYAARNETDI